MLISSLAKVCGTPGKDGVATPSGVVNTYYSGIGTASTPKKSFQVIRIPQYVSASLSGGVTALPWDVASGGIVAFDVYNTLNFSGQSIDVTGKGFRGGGSQDLNGRWRWWWCRNYD